MLLLNWLLGGHFKGTPRALTITDKSFISSVAPNVVFVESVINRGLSFSGREKR